MKRLDASHTALIVAASYYEHTVDDMGFTDPTDYCSPDGAGGTQQIHPGSAVLERELGRLA